MLLFDSDILRVTNAYLSKPHDLTDKSRKCECIFLFLTGRTQFPSSPPPPHLLPTSIWISFCSLLIATHSQSLKQHLKGRFLPLGLYLLPNMSTLQNQNTKSQAVKIESAQTGLAKQEASNGTYPIHLYPRPNHKLIRNRWQRKRYTTWVKWFCRKWQSLQSQCPRASRWTW